MSSIPRSFPTQAPALLSSPARWDRKIFRTLETPDKVCPEVIDITGRARCLIYGPYVQLAQGLWRATVSFELCEEAARRSFTVQLGSLKSGFATVELPQGVPGRHDVEVLQNVSDGEAVEVRVWVKTAAFHGELRFLGVAIEPVAEACAALRLVTG